MSGKKEKSKEEKKETEAERKRREEENRITEEEKKNDLLKQVGCKMCITIFLFFFRPDTYIVVFDTHFDLNVVLGFTLLSRGIYYGWGDGRWGKKKKCRRKMKCFLI